jgi:membrane protease YdiL (CAAX protease family)
MARVRAFIAAHPVATYVALAFAISWGGLLAAVVSTIPGSAADVARLLPWAVLAMIAGPSIGGLAVIALGQGRAGLRRMRARLLTWQVPLRLYAVALLLAPLAAVAVLVPLWLVAREFTPGIVSAPAKSTFVLGGVLVGLGAGIFEEVGWTGCATPALRRRYGALATGLILGVVWAAWHVLAAAWGGGNRFPASPVASYLIDPFLFLVPFRVVMVWLHDRTQSLLLGMLMHVSLTSSVMILGATGLAGVHLLAFDLAWLVVVGCAGAAIVKGVR